jgi:single-strand DNA-binding protein
MSGELNVTLVGNLTSAPELRFIPSSGRPVCSFTVAQTPRHYDSKSSSWTDGDTVFMRVSVFGQPAENIAASELPQGARVVVTGSLLQRSYEDREGVKRTVVEVRATDVAASMRYATVGVTKVSGRTQDQDADVYQGPWSDDQQ